MGIVPAQAYKRKSKNEKACDEFEKFLVRTNEHQVYRKFMFKTLE